MKNIAYIDIEVIVNSGKIDRLGLVLGSTKKSTTSVNEIKYLLEEKKLDFICGHNFIDHDKVFLSKTVLNPILEKTPIIDTLLLSMLLFINKKTHKLDKPYKTEINIENQPLGDAKQTQALFYFLDEKFDNLDTIKKKIFFNLLNKNRYFSGYFQYKDHNYEKIDIYEFVKNSVRCTKLEFKEIEENFSLELAFILSFLNSDKKASISFVVLKKFPKIIELLKKLTFDKSTIDLDEFANQEFNIPSFRDFEKEDNSSNLEKSDLFASEDELSKKNQRISQKDIIQSAMNDESLLAILPTGGGKTFTFQLPALVKAKIYKGLTVVISPLQALMKNHVDSFKENNQNFSVIAISGYLSPIERMNAISEIENGVVDILYLAPEALRSNSIFKALQRRVIERFVIDEAHCFSSWGHDFRHDYYFVADSIKELEKSSDFQPKIPVSCFTATAKPEVLSDIKNYFKDKLNITLSEFIASSKRYNLKYRVIEVSSKEDKYEELIRVLTNSGKKPTIIYIPQNARECKILSETLNVDERLSYLDLVIEPFYSKIDDEIENKKRVGRNKGEILNDFIDNKIDIVIATTAFGMGIDKPDIQCVIHYEQSDSLESYLQESGRGARKEELEAECIVLYSKDDFNRTFSKLNSAKLEYHEIDRVVKELQKIKREEIYLSPKEIAQKMGIDTDDSKIDYDTMIKTALLELEQANIIKRGRNSYKIFATSTIDKEKRSMDYVHEVLDCKKSEYENIYQYMIMVMQNIIQRSKVDTIEVDDLADVVAVKKSVMFEVLYALQKESLLEYNNDISVHVKKSVKNDFNKHFEIESLILKKLIDLPEYEKTLDLRDINIEISDKNQIKTIKKIIQSWTHLSKLRAYIFNAYFHKNICHFEIEEIAKNRLVKLVNIRKEVCEFIIESMLKELDGEKEAEIELSTNKLKEEHDKIQELSLDGFHHSFVYLHELIKDSFELRRGRLIYYQAFKIQKQENIENKPPYKKREHYNKSLKPYYKRKIESIHIQIAFLEKLIKEGWDKTSIFVTDYFGMEYSAFKKKYNFDDKKIQLPITKERYKEILENLNDEQKRIFDDKKSSAIMVLAGPGSGKTKVLVHKIASLITIENNKPEYFLMLAHSRVAVAEFRYRLKKLIGSQIYDIKIYTFHSFAIELLGEKINGRESLLHNVIDNATGMIENGTINLPYIQMLVLDEYQDVSYNTYRFIKAIYSKMSKDKKILAVGDDNQCINDFGKDKADIAFIKQFQNDFEEVNYKKDGLIEKEVSNFFKYELAINYRSQKNIVNLANNYSKSFKKRLKSKDLFSNSKEDGYIELIKYRNSSYVQNIINKVSNDKSDTIAILARNNDEVLTIYSLLVANNIKAKYIAKQDGFRLGHIVELQEFLEFWKQSSFEEAYTKIELVYKASRNYGLMISVIKNFYNEHEGEIEKSQKHFELEFSEYLEEITFEEFELSKTNVIVSTMHKAKGKEFDSVYVCIDEKFKINDYEERLLYVSITRAKNRLSIHTKNSILDFLEPDIGVVSEYNKNDEEPNRIVFLMGLGDIALSDNISVSGIENTRPIAGEKVKIIQKEDNFIILKETQQISKLAKINIEKSNRLSNKIMQKQKIGYILERNVDIDYIVTWFSKDKNRTFKQVLCKVYMRKK